MSYINEFEAELLKKLNGAEDTGAIVRWISEKVLESVSGGMKVEESRRFEILFSSVTFSSPTSR